MGIKQCDRVGCQNVLCDTCIGGKVYLCDGCVSEFKEICNGKRETKRYFNNVLLMFLNTPKPYESPLISFDEFLKS